ncbi:archease [Methanobrevibacter arboriphilus]|uniref:Archease n=1 Tax=Methanobrevibacter arboriphilus TaxID=39441 RepID=A0ACA8R3G1_METAZ|nr:archease [Methanobrevibacter arboriphilus]GLI11050.1 archease [Methanobrevibacter arboriphilus]
MINMIEENRTNHKNIQKKFEFFDVTADIGYWAYGKTLEEAFENSALAMFNVITNVKKVDKKEIKEFNIESEDKISLLYDFLEELLFIHEVNLLLFSNFTVSIEKKNSGDNKFYKLNAIVEGEKIDWKIHERRSEVKAITFHMMEVSCNELCKIRVILDL